MTSFEETLWRRLEENGAGVVNVPTHRRLRPVAMTAGGAGVIAGAAAAGVLLIGGTTNAPPAYALTAQSDGTYTVTLNSLTTGIPALNAKLDQLGIPVTVVPVQASCTASSYGPLQLGSTTASQTVTLDASNIPAGSQGFIAAEQQPDGQVLLAEGTSSSPIPSCFPTTPSLGIPDPASHSGSSQSNLRASKRSKLHASRVKGSRSGGMGLPLRRKRVKS